MVMDYRVLADRSKGKGVYSGISQQSQNRAPPDPILPVLRLLWSVKSVFRLGSVEGFGKCYNRGVIWAFRVFRVLG